MFRFLSILGVSGAISTAALASFEMLLVADNGANTTPTRRIHRFDPDSGVYLGAFGNFSSDIRAMSIRQGRNEAYVLSGSTVFVFDYNTGALKKDYSGWTFADIAFSQDDQSFYGVSNNLIYKTSTAAIDAGTFVPSIWVAEAGTTQITSVSVTASNVVMTGQIRAGSAFEYRYDGAIGGVGSTSTSYSAGVTLGASENLIGAGAIQAYTFSGFGRASRYTASGISIGALFASQMGTATAASSAHSGAYIVGIDLATPTQGIITKFSASGAEMQSFGGSVLRKPVAMSSVLAPEPGTMIALGAGVLALLRRRRK